MKKLVVAAGIAAAITVPVAQVQAQAGQYRPPECDLKTGHFLVNSGVVYIKGASEETFPDKRDRMLRDAERNLLQAIDRGQGDNPATWYFLGRYYVMVNDPIGADSAFHRAERLAPECTQDILFYRRALWVPLINRAVDSMNAHDYPSAKQILRGANAIYGLDPIGFYYLGSIFGNENNADSALFYFKRVAEIGAPDSTRRDIVNNATYNVGLLEGILEHWDSAAVWYERYRTLRPDDPQGLTGLANAYAQIGDDQKAVMLYDSVMASAAQMDPIGLFQAGQTLFNAGALDLAARAFALGLEKNPYHRDALYNITNTYLAIAQDTATSQAKRTEAAKQMETYAHRLLQVEPRGQEAMRLLAASYQLQKLSDSTLAMLERIDAMPFGIEVYVAQVEVSGYLVRGKISNLKDAVTKVPTITFEFLDKNGTVVDTNTLSVTSLEAHGSQEFKVATTKENVAGWRYSVGG